MVRQNQRKFQAKRKMKFGQYQKAYRIAAIHERRETRAIQYTAKTRTLLYRHCLSPTDGREAKLFSI